MSFLTTPSAPETVNLAIRLLGELAIDPLRVRRAADMLSVHDGMLVCQMEIHTISVSPLLGTVFVVVPAGSPDASRLRTAVAENLASDRYLAARLSRHMQPRATRLHAAAERRFRAAWQPQYNILYEQWRKRGVERPPHAEIEEAMEDMPESRRLDRIRASIAERQRRLWNRANPGFARVGGGFTDYQRSLAP